MKKEKVLSAWSIFCFFFKIGCFTFGGGWSILAQMEQEFVLKRQIVTKDELVELAALGKSLPGIMITNIAMLFGCRVNGWAGGIAAVAGITSPAVLILSLVTYGYDTFKDNYWCHCAMKGIQTAVVPIITSTAFSLGKSAFATTRGKVIGIITFMACVFTDISNIVLVLSGVAAALMWRGVRKHGIL